MRRNLAKSLPLNGPDLSALILYTPGSLYMAGTLGATGFERSTCYTDTPNMDGNCAQLPTTCNS